MEDEITRPDLKPEQRARARARWALVRHLVAHTTFKQEKKMSLADAVIMYHSRQEMLKRMGSLQRAVFWSNFLQYISDNVLVMMAAASAGVGLKSPNPDAPPLALFIRQCANILINLGILWALRRVLLYIGGDRPCPQRLVQSPGMPSRRSCHGCLASPVAGTTRARYPLGANFVAALNAWLMDVIGYGQSPGSVCGSDGRVGDCTRVTGAAFLIDLALASAFFMLCWRLSITCSLRANSTEPDASEASYFMQVAYMVTLSGSGKTIFYLFGTLANAVTTGDQQDPNESWFISRLLWITIATLAAAWVIGCGAHRLKRAAKDYSQKAQAQNIEYIFVYWWAFSFVDSLWVRSLPPSLRRQRCHQSQRRACR
eukprot:CAMPEP_0115885708 /NCGR_PEP_ID=MMETSP0287-20121206/30819_1 /TAXON_ID=412157 /ORGANISM="Chrysochromulina rotalis, Strain UIO044" /LENGTH=370 /DNA_ID=CAMNT_0003342145 /DNA_START=85 /DNA_END=1194 /DNA_ORIENTATION=+